MSLYILNCLKNCLVEFESIYNALLELKGYKQMFGVNYDDSILTKTFENKQKLLVVEEVETLLKEFEKFQNKKINALDSKAFFKESLLAQFPFHLFWKNNKREYEGCNRNYARFHGLDKTSQIFGKINIDLFDDKVMLQEVDKLESRALSTCVQQYEVINHHDKEDEIRLVHAYRIPILGEDGNCLGLLGIEFPHGQNASPPNKLKEQNQALNALLNHSNTHLLSLSPNGNILFANKKAHQTFGLPTPLGNFNFRQLLCKDNENANLENFNTIIQKMAEGEEVNSQFSLMTASKENTIFQLRFVFSDNKILLEISEIDDQYLDLYKVSSQTTSEIKMSVNQVVHFRNITSRAKIHSAQNKRDERLFTESILKLRRNVIEYQDYLSIQDEITHYKKHDLNELLDLAKKDLDTNDPGYNVDLQYDILPKVSVSATLFINFFQRIIKVAFIQCDKREGVPIYIRVTESDLFYNFTIDCKLKQDALKKKKVSKNSPMVYSRGINLSLHICQSIIAKHGGKMKSEWKGNNLFTIRFSLPKKS